MTLDRLSQITEVGIKSGITLRNINVEGAYVSGVITATSLAITGAGISITGVVTATSFDGNATGRINPSALNVTGVATFQGNVFHGDGDIAFFGDGQDLLIFHNSTDSIIRDIGDGDLFIEGGNRIRLTNPTGIETYAVFNQDGASELWYDNTKKFETTGAGVSISGIVSATSFSGNSLVVSGMTTATGGIQVGATTSITVGDTFIRRGAVGLGTTSTTGRNAGVSTAQGTLIFNSDTGSVQVYNGNAWRDVGKEAINATGGYINEYTDSTTGKIYRAHIFTSSGFFTVPSAPPSATIDHLVVGGGGGGGNTRAGGGGAGGFIAGSGTPVSTNPGVYTITVGGGGFGGLFPNGDATSGNSSSIANPLLTTITSQGGGKGGGRSVPSAIGFPGAPGGSGGGGGVDPAAVTGGTGNRVTGTSTPAPAQGSNGGTNPGGSNDRGSGGGGASQAGDVGGPGSPGKGGDGSPSAITGITTHYAGGGGGGCGPSTPAAGAGGLGGGGAGARGALGNPPGTPGTVATGGGGGGGADDAHGGQGGSGIVVVRYEIGQVGGTAKATGGAISYTPTTTVHTFYSSGVFTVTNPALTSANVLIVGGGGGGGSFPGNGAGGGGAGGLLEGPVILSTSPGLYAVTVGGGGPMGSPSGSGINGSSSSLQNPTLGTATASGGGGGSGSNGAGNPGASGGGAGGNSLTNASGTQLPFEYTIGSISGSLHGFGNPGGQASPGGLGGGGGGAGGAGNNGAFPATSLSGKGGAGRVNTYGGQAAIYAAGGKSETAFAPGTNLTPAAANTGNGGDGKGNPGLGGSGGSGIVIIAYPS